MNFLAITWDWNPEIINPRYANFHHEFYILSVLCYRYLLKHFGFPKIKKFLVDWSKRTIKSEFNKKFKKHFSTWTSFNTMNELSCALAYFTSGLCP